MPGIKSKKPSPPSCGSLVKFNLSTLKTFKSGVSVTVLIGAGKGFASVM